jgi:ferredoxin
LNAPGVRVRFEPSGREVHAAFGERVLDAAEARGVVALPLACRAGNCGACLVNVPQGADALAPPAAREAETLSALGARPGQRLGCQLRIRDAAESGDLVVLSAARAPFGGAAIRSTTS